MEEEARRLCQLSAVRRRGEPAVGAEHRGTYFVPFDQQQEQLSAFISGKREAKKKVAALARV